MDQKSKQPSLYIIGAGVSGLIAATVLEKKGLSPVILEASDRLGGRVKTDIVEDYQLDHGFQVLLDAYPKAQEYLDYEKLDLQRLSPGAIIFNQGQSFTIGDPLRRIKFLFPSLFSSIGTLGDKTKILKLNNQLKQKPLDEIFETPEKTTLQYLKDYGFSEKMISHFFKPFFSGIFLETELSTSSRMFEFVYKMFGEGFAVIPKAGMQAIPQQLADQLKNTEIRLNEPVKKVAANEIELSSGEKLKADFIIVTSNAESLIPNYTSSLAWKRCDNLYFKTPRRTIREPIIGLNGKRDALINNLFFPTGIATDSKGGEELLSVTVVKDHQLDELQLIEAVQKELADDFGIDTATFLKRFEIPSALPDLNNLQYKREPSESLINDHIAVAGDQLLNGSLNAAMVAGESAALAAIGTLERS